MVLSNLHKKFGEVRLWGLWGELVIFVWLGTLLMPDRSF